MENQSSIPTETRPPFLVAEIREEGEAPEPDGIQSDFLKFPRECIFKDI